MRDSEQAPPAGVLVVDKPSGPTSHDVVAQARRCFQTRRVGHAGTLDPLATGVLVLLFGEATKLSELVTHGDKAYEAEVCFGRSTDSCDAAGRTIAELSGPLALPSASSLQRALDGERRRVLQLPPAVSAIKVAGERAYRLARRGAPPELAPRPVAVHELRLLEWNSASARLRVWLRVSKGYYVRAFARDLGQAVGIPAHLGQLRRTHSGPFGLAEACAWPPEPLALPVPTPLARALPRVLPVARLTATGRERATRGQPLTLDDFSERPLAAPAPPRSVPLEAWVSMDGQPIAIGLRDGEVFRVRRGFSPRASSTR